MSAFTPNQERAIAAHGNILVAAGAGTGKTRTLVERCIRLFLDPQQGASARDILVVTFTEAAAAELRERVRTALLERQSENPADEWIAEQLTLLEVANIGTLHGFCFKLVRDHFHELGLDPQMTILTDGQDQLLMDTVFEELMAQHYAGQGDTALAVLDLLDLYADGDPSRIKDHIFRLHHYSQTLPEPQRWFDEQLAATASPTPQAWEGWFGSAVREWIATWRSEIEHFGENTNMARVLALLNSVSATATRIELAPLLITVSDLAETKNWESGDATKVRDQVKGFWKEAKFLKSLVPPESGPDPLAQDWDWVRRPMNTLLTLATEFGVQFATAKREQGVLDFHDLEQFTLELLVDRSRGGVITPLAKRTRQRFKFVFVDEYQDINAAQDAILQALSRAGTEANRFLVGDVKQSIYRFRLADPRIFQRYQREWNGGEAGAESTTVVHLSDNFRSRPKLLDFVNGFFQTVMRETVGGVEYDADAALRAGPRKGAYRKILNADTASNVPRVQVHLVVKRAKETANAAEPGEEDAEEPEALEGPVADLLRGERQARLTAQQLRALKESGHLVWDEALEKLRPVQWRDMAVLLRAVKGQADGYAREFRRAGIPLEATRGGFYGALEISDLLSLLQLLDNSLQDVPTLAVLRCPLVGLSVNELVTIRVTWRDTLFWNALQKYHQSGGNSPLGVHASACPDNPTSTWTKVNQFLERFERWRKIAREASLSERLEQILEETHYREWLLTQPRGEQQLANVRRLLVLTRQFDPLQRQGLRRFLKFVEAQEEAQADTESPALQSTDAVRLQTIHASKGLEFPVVALADLSRGFNLQDAHRDLILDEVLGLCPRVKPPGTHGSYPSLPHWMATARQKRETLGEELRLLYVGMTRARDTLLLISSVAEKKLVEKWTEIEPDHFTPATLLAARSYLDWLGPWMELQARQAGQSLKNGSGIAGSFAWQVHEWDEALEPEILPPRPESPAAAPSQLSLFPPPELDALRARMEWQYPFVDATEIRAKATVTELRRAWMDEDSEAAPLVGKASTSTFTLPTAGRAKRSLSAAQIGLAHHRFLECFDLDQAVSIESLQIEAERLAAGGLLTTEESEVLDLPSLLNFWTSEIGQTILARKQFVNREIPFTARFEASELPEGFSSKSEFIVVQGVVDLAVIQKEEIWIVDFKTDQLTEAELPTKITEYAPQVKIYGKALERIYRRPVRQRWLHFLRLGRTAAV